MNRIMKAFGDIEEGELGDALLLALNLFIAMAGYYVIKTVREPLILAGGGAEWKSYSSAAQAVVMAFFFIPIYSRLSATVTPIRLNFILIGFFLVSTEVFWLLAQFDVPYLGVAFYIWVGLFSLSIVSQFWSYANALYTKSQGERLFPIIAIGATLGSPLGSAIAAQLFDLGWTAYSMLHLTAGMLVIHGILYYVISKRLGAKTERDDKPKEKKDSSNGFALVFKNPYLMFLAGMLIMLNLVNTTGEYILSSYVVEAANEAIIGAADPEAAKGKFIGSFYGNFFSVVNVAAFVIQTFLVAQIVRFLGIRGVLFALPVVAVGTYGLVAAGVGLTIFRWAKTAENSTDYSVMNTAKAMLWLPTTKEEKFAAKQTIDTFFVRLGDVFSAGFVFLGTEYLNFETQHFGFANLLFIVVWVFIAYRVYTFYRAMTDTTPIEEVFE